MTQVQLQYLFRDKPCHPDTEPADYDSLDIVSGGCHLYGEIMWPDGELSSPRPCIVLFHGFPGSARNDDLAHALCRIGCVVLVPHHRGAWGSEGSYSVSNCIEDAVAVADYVRGREFCLRYNTHPDAVFFVGHSMGANTVIHAARRLPWLRGLVVLTPFDPITHIREHEEERLRELLQQASLLRCEGPEAIYQDILSHRASLGFENALDALKQQNLFCAAGSKDLCAPTDRMFGPLWRMLRASSPRGIQRLVEYPAGHGLLGCRCALIKDVAQFVFDVLEAWQDVRRS